jgi:hypothetical protein
MEWPDLNSYGYVSGRAANEHDVMAGNAVFLLQSGDEVLSTPMDIEVPQYALHIDMVNDMETLGIIIQAEEVNGQQLVGFVPFDTEVPITTALQEFKLLGQNKPAP